VERYQQKRVEDMQLSSRVKDWFREGQVPHIVALLNQVLQNYALFETKTVKGTLKVIASLVDWNEVALFDCCRSKITEFLRVKQLRAGAFQCLAAFVGKGMAESDKLAMIH